MDLNLILETVQNPFFSFFFFLFSLLFIVARARIKFDKLVVAPDKPSTGTFSMAFEAIFLVQDTRLVHLN